MPKNDFVKLVIDARYLNSLTDLRKDSWPLEAVQMIMTNGFHGLCGLPKFFSRLMTIHFDPLIKKKQAITYIDDTIMQSQNKNEMFTVVKKYHTLLTKAGLKAAPDTTFFLLKKIKFLGHVISPEGIQPIPKRVKDLKKLKAPESKTDVMKIPGCLLTQLLYQEPPCGQSTFLQPN